MQSDGTRTLKMHRKCRTYYIEKKRREAAKKKRVAVCPSNPGSSPPKRRSITAGTSPGFDIKRDCFFCGRNQDNIGKKTENLLSDVSVIGTLSGPMV